MIRLFFCILVFTCIPASSIMAQPSLNERLLLASPTTISADNELTQHMNSLASKAISEHCAACHGPKLTGGISVPNLVDYDWQWGVTGFEMTSVEPVMQIMQTILYGVRDTDCPEETKRYGACPDTRYSEMPGYTYFSSAEISDMVELVLSLSGADSNADAVDRAQALWPICTECHGVDGYGDKVYGGPNLKDDVWLFGNTREQIKAVITEGRRGVCPAWAEVLDAATIKALAVYLYLESST